MVNRLSRWLSADACWPFRPGTVTETGAQNCARPAVTRRMAPHFEAADWVFAPDLQPRRRHVWMDQLAVNKGPQDWGLRWEQATLGENGGTAVCMAVGWKKKRRVVLSHVCLWQAPHHQLQALPLGRAIGQ